jgi:hypothetical protein
MSAVIAGHKVSDQALNDFEKKDVELSVPEGAPRPILVIVMVCIQRLRDEYWMC